VDEGQRVQVTRTNYDSDRKVYAWRHDVRSGPSPTLRISRQVLEGYPAFIVGYQLDQLKVASAIGAEPAAYLMIVQKGLKRWKCLKESRVGTRRGRCKGVGATCSHLVASSRSNRGLPRRGAKFGSILSQPGVR
jgi:hypothetical protein